MLYDIPILEEERLHISKALEKRVVTIMPVESLLARAQVVLGEEQRRSLIQDRGLRAFVELVRNIYFAPVLADIETRFAGQAVGVRGLVAARGISFVTPLQVEDAVAMIRLPAVADILSIGTDRPKRRYLEAYNLNYWYGVRHETTVPFCQIIVNFWRNALGHKDRQKLLPLVCVYDLSLLSRRRGQGYFNLPEDKNVRRRLILAVYPVALTDLLPVNP